MELSSPLGPDEYVTSGELAGRRGRAHDVEIGQEGATLLPTEELLGGGDQLALRGDLGTVVHGDQDQFLGRLIARDEGDLEERRLDGFHQRGRVEQQDLRQLCARNPPVADGDLLGLPKALELGLRPVDLQRGNQARREPRGEVHQEFGPGDRCPDA